MMDTFQVFKRCNKPKISLIVGIEALRILGPRIFLQKLKYQIYSSTMHLCLGKELEGVPPLPESLNFLDLSPASSEDVGLFFELMAKEGGSSVYEMLVRKNFYKIGFHNCHIGRLKDSQEMVSITWLVSADEIKKAKFEHRFPIIQEGTAYAEHTFTLKKSRGMGVMNSTGCQQELIAKKQGLKRLYYIVREDNPAPLKSSKKRGHVVYNKFVISKRLFHEKMKILEQYNPPIQISI